MSEVWPTVHEERKALIHDLKNLNGEQWNTQSLCDGWTIHDVLAHLIDDAKSTKMSFVLAMAKAGFNFDRLNKNGVNREKRAYPQETLAEFRIAADRTSSAPAPLATRYVEIIVHGEDIRRPLGILHEYPVDAIIAAINYQLETSGSMGGSKDRASGLGLIATDLEWSHGSGDEVRGKSIDLLLALTGRTISAEALSGSGVALLTQRRGGA